MLCSRCGNEIESGSPCPVCESAGTGRTDRSPRSVLCPGCGNEIYNNEPCPICKEGRAYRKRGPQQDTVKEAMCPRCGNMVEDVHQCPICSAGRAPAKAREAQAEGVVCPQCHEALEDQDWDGVVVGMCPTCSGCFFPPGGLERTLDKLADGPQYEDGNQLVAEYRSAKQRVLQESFRYKACPICRLSMTRRNYAGVSGVIVDLCGKHGVWVSQTAFSELSDFMAHGGKAFAERKRRR